MTHPPPRNLPPTPLLELLIQPDPCSKPASHPPLHPLTVRAERSQDAVRFLLNHLNFANTGDVYPFPAGDVIRERLKVALDHFPNQRLSQRPPLTRHMCNTLCMIHAVLLICRCENDSTDNRQYRQIVVGCRCVGVVGVVGKLRLLTDMLNSDEPLRAIHAALFNQPCANEVLRQLSRLFRREI